jgi:multiple sugar transport system permease protein
MGQAMDAEQIRLPVSRVTIRSPWVLIGRAGKRSLLNLIAILGSILIMIPFVWTLTSSLKPALEIRKIPPLLLPSQFMWSNYIDVWQAQFFAGWFRNSVLIASLATLGTVLSAALAGYAFARFKFPGRGVLFALTIGTMMLPYEVTLIPSYIMYFLIGWLNTYFPLIVPGWLGGGAFFIFLFRQFFMTIPMDLDEAAKIDGANHFQILGYVVMPLSLPVLATGAIIAFVNNWNSFIFPLVILKDTAKFPVSVGLRHFAVQLIQSDNYKILDHLLLAGAVIMTLPIVIIFFFGQQYFVRGVVLSGLKG